VDEVVAWLNELILSGAFGYVSLYYLFTYSALGNAKNKDSIICDWFLGIVIIMS
jgi:hypothetical protein